VAYGAVKHLNLSNIPSAHLFTSIERITSMSKFLSLMFISAFLVCTGFPAFAETSEMGRQQGTQSGTQSGDSTQGMGSSIESQNPSHRSQESQEQKGARPGEAGEEGETSIFGSPSTMPPSEDSPGYTGADKEQHERERGHQGR
jgi:predicted lipid-binding transport protein (Tim44 family)